MTANIVKFLETVPDDKLAALRAHTEDGKLVYNSCCCLIGAPSADHALIGEGYCVKQGGHVDKARRSNPYAEEAETEFCSLGWDGISHSDKRRREGLLPLIIAEQERRERDRLEDEAAQMEGELIETSGYPDPVHERNGR